MSKAVVVGKPYVKKVTCKGNVPSKLKEVGIDHSGINQYLIPLSVDVSTECAGIASKVCSAIRERVAKKSGVSYADTLEKDNFNGAGYMAELEKAIAEKLAEVALGTAVQGTAFKSNFIRLNSLPADIFESDKTVAKKAVVAVDDFE